MSNSVWPSNIPGLTFSGRRVPMWKTGVQEAVSGKESRIAYSVYPRIRFELQYEILHDDTAPSELKALVGLFNSVQGRFDSFLYTDPDFSSVTDEQFGVGTGSATTFQLTAKFQNSGGPGYAEIIQNLNGAPVIKDNGSVVPGGNYSINSVGVITFTTPPTTGHTLTWTGSFYYRVRFDDDEFDVSEFMDRWWQIDSIVLKSIKL